MQVNKAIYTKQGTLQFDGELDGPELDKVIEVGLTVLVQMGVLKPSAQNKEPKSPIIGA